MAGDILCHNITVLTLKEGFLVRFKVAESLRVPVASVRKESDSCSGGDFILHDSLCLGVPSCPHFYICSSWAVAVKSSVWSRRGGSATFLGILSLQGAPGLPSQVKADLSRARATQTADSNKWPGWDSGRGHGYPLIHLKWNQTPALWREKNTLKNGSFIAKFSGCQWRFLEAWENLWVFSSWRMEDRWGSDTSALDLLSGAQAMIGVVLPCWSLLLTSRFPGDFAIRFFATAA